MKQFINILYRTLLLLPTLVYGFQDSIYAQVDQIELTASFRSSIDLTVISGSNIYFSISNIDEYQNGLEDPNTYSSVFEVNSSVDFRVELSSTDFISGTGNILSSKNFGFTIDDIGTHRTGRNHKFMGTATSPSHLNLLGSDIELITPSGQGNSGSADANRFRLTFELGTAETRKKSGLPTLLDQNITPGTYSSIITLTASGMP